MRERDELSAVIARIYEGQRSCASISPASLAKEAMEAIEFPPSLHSLGYIGCDLYFRDIARRFCRQRFDPIANAGDREDDLFPETLQDRYPVRPRTGDDPHYVLRHELSIDDRAYNVARMRAASDALARHADALEAEGRLFA